MDSCPDPFAPAKGTLLCRADTVGDGDCKELRFGAGDRLFSLFLYRRGDRIRGYVNNCPHFSLPLNTSPDKFLLVEDGYLMCAWHCAVFRLEDGHCTDGPAKGLSLEAIPVIEINQHFYIGT
jgi:nitrite reductase/ring-hydroxylating ferredoxin subunit